MEDKQKKPRKPNTSNPLEPFKNDKWEVFCHALARGETQGQAAICAGFAPNCAASQGCKLAKRQVIKDRVAFIKSQTSKLSIERVSVSKSWVLQELKENVVAAKVEDDHSAVNRGLELIGKELGMFVERKIVGLQDLRSASADELFTLLAEIDSTMETGQLTDGSQDTP